MASAGELPRYRFAEIPPATVELSATDLRNDGSVLYTGFPARIYRSGSGFEYLPFNLGQTKFEGDSHGRFGWGPNIGSPEALATLRQPDGTLERILPMSGFRDTRFVTMNDNGVIVGDSADQDSHEWAFVYKNGVRTDLNPGGGYYEPQAVDVNDRGTVLFFNSGSIFAGTKDQSFFYRDGVYTGFGSVPGLGFEIMAQAINNRDDVLAGGKICYRNLDGSYAAVKPTIPSGFKNPVLEDLNDQGIAVGHAFSVAGGQSTYGFISDGASTRMLTDLLVGDTSGVTRASAYQFNSKGWMLGNYTRNGKTSTAIFIPVPEPATWLAMGVGLAAVMRRRRSRTRS